MAKKISTGLPRMELKSQMVEMGVCRVCGSELRRNNPMQVVKYCSKECRKRRNK